MTALCQFCEDSREYHARHTQRLTQIDVQHALGVDGLNFGLLRRLGTIPEPVARDADGAMLWDAEAIAGVAARLAGSAGR